ncbi:MAG: thioredoxin domain-containing protein [Candidatus Diapherotrites archaeon]|nr:thioredoxin domain-containing protein [Candidatus Diapherotrites archaeon]
MDNPKKIEWLEWSSEAFEKAKKEKKPILLDIHGTWCHWCHVMDQTTYANEAVAGFVSENFVPVKVDTDRRPDINERYNAGGWPSTVVLTAQGVIVLQATYMPPRELLVFLKSAIASSFSSSMQKNPEAEKLLHAQISPRRVLLDESELVKGVLAQARDSFDEFFGGFGAEPKFPMPDLLCFLELHWLYFRDADVKNILLGTLSQMALGGLFDSQENGFFRYSTTRDWSIPHYEKMLEDNARLCGVYLDAYRLFGREEFLSTAEKTLSYLREKLFDKNSSLFFSSQSADEEYYLHLAKDREKLRAPPVDKTIFTDLNSLAAEALLKAWVVTGEKEYKAMALACLKSLLSRCFDGQKLFHFREGPAKQEAFLQDYALLIHALLKAFACTQENFFLKTALSLESIAEEKFLDKNGVGFFDTPRDSLHSPGLLSRRKKPFAPNSVMVENLLVLSILAGRKELAVTGEKTQLHAASQAIESGVFGAASAQTSLKTAKGFITAEIKSPKSDWEDFLRKILHNDFNNLVITGIETFKEPGKASVLFCAKDKCLPPMAGITGLELYEKI